MSETAFAKLNLALHVRGRLLDGRHRIQTLFAFCEDGDVLTANPADGLSLTIAGPFAEELSSDEDNLVLRAASELRVATGTQRGAALHLTKNLPIASGVGGGSADAAAALRLLTRMWAVNPAIPAEIAPRLGADVPACLWSSPCRGEGAGDEVERVSLPELTGQPILLVNPRSPLATGQVFAAWDGLDRGPLTDWRHGRNDLENPATLLVPAISDVRDWLVAQAGAHFVRMSGSGATCFAMFGSDVERDCAAAAVPHGWWHMASRLR